MSETTASLKTSDNSQNTSAHPSLGEAAGIWARIGVLSFGGPAGQIALMHRILVDEKKWISETRFLHALNYCMLLPGPEAQQLATYVGWLLHGTRGGVIAGTLFVIPGFIVIVALSTLYALHQQTIWFEGLFFGLKAAVLAVVIEALIKISRRALKSNAAYVIAAAAFIAIFAFHVPFPLIVATAAIIGIAQARFQPEQSPGDTAEASNGSAADRAIDAGLVDSQPSVRRTIRLIATWGALWIAPFVACGAIFGFDSVFAQIMMFFSKMAVVTFGGAYAVLAYVAQQAVETLGWLRPGEMLDGLAMAETTPGPLVIVLTYVGFLAGFRDAMGLSPVAAGLLGATLTTWATFVPCFLWIFLGAPHVERLRSNKTLGGALTAITAAVVGVILNLAVWFALHVLFAEVGTLTLGPLTPVWPVWSSLDVASLGLVVGAFVALFGVRIGMIPTLGLSALAGLAITLAT